MDNRPNWDEYFMDIAKLVSTRSTCIRRHVGAVIVRERQILSTGYNGAPKGLNHCINIGCEREKLNIPSGQRHEICRGVHAEQNAIVQAAYNGISIKGSTIYTTVRPCILCAKLIINAGIKVIIFEGEYASDKAMDLIKEADIEIIRLKKEN
ncbi:MAG: dCMP deaminase family protein [Peptostreptococcaceae bacterium]|jgi:dCMP deaminase|nr:dCMP deaminase family protein [Peptostreptococcaceae bacterium]